MRILKIFSCFLFLSLVSLAQANSTSMSAFKYNPIYLKRNNAVPLNKIHLNTLSGLGGIKDLDGNPIYTIRYNNNTLYAGSGVGNIWAYNNGAWIQDGTTPSNQWLSDFTFDSNNNIFVGDGAYGWVYKYVNNEWLSVSGSAESGKLDG